MLISISGIDGCGKTIQVEMLRNWFLKQSKSVVVVKAYDEVAKIACRMFMETWTDDVAIMFLFQALHAHQYAITNESLKKGDIVIADRWDESYLAYHQNFGFLATQTNVRSLLNSLAFHDKVPDVGFIIEVPVEIARKRRESRGKLERFEDRSDEYYKIVQKTYKSIATERNWFMLDGQKTPQEIHDDIVNVLLLR